MGTVPAECRSKRTLFLADQPGKSTLLSGKWRLTQLEILDHLPPDTDVSTIVLSNKPVSSKPAPDRERRLADLPGVELRQVGLSYVSIEGELRTVN